MNLSSYAPEVRHFYANVLANGGSANAPTLSALSHFVRNLQGRAALWSLIDEIYPLVGSGLPAACTKLKYISTPYLTNHNFTDDDFEEWGPTSGLKGDGATKYLDTNFLATTLPKNEHLSVVEYSATGGGGPPPRTALGVTDAVLQWSLGALIELDDRNAHSGNQQATLPSPYANYTSWYLSNRTTPNNLELWKRTHLKATNNIPATITPKPALNLFLFARNNVGTPDQHWNTTLRFATIGQSLTATQTADLYAAIQTFQQSLGRCV